MTTHTRLPTHRKPTRTFSAATPADLPDDVDLAERLATLLTTEGMQLPPLGGTAARMHRLALDPRSTLDQVLQLIQHEPSLALRVMRLANSAAMSPAHPAKDLRAALLRVGILGARDMAFALSLGAVVHAAALREDLAGVYRHSYMVASGSHWACRAVGLDSAQGFLCGLMHDIGALGILVALAPHVQKDATLANRAAIRLLVDREHQQVGEDLLTTWHLPSLVVAVARWHHRPEHAGAAEPLVRLIAAVDKAAEAMAANPQDGVAPLMELPELFVAGLSPPQVRALGVVLDEAAKDSTADALVA
ncbi:MAG: HDOD domain-containing protein [Deltaproteobacteria bacterium]|nr:HDOD domain-containing protein [Deltaproteobacteria bacterium]